MYKIDLLRHIEANTRGGAVSDCYSKYDLWRMIERNTRSKPNPPYQLDNGAWDMSNRELVKFSRSTKAWLDGKEYAPDEPRYTKDGDLLIEGQVTNLFPLAFPYNFYTYGGTWTFTQADEWTEATNVDGAGFIELNRHTGLKPYHKYAVYLTVKKTNDYHFNLRFYDPMVHNVFKHDLPLPPNTENLHVVDAGDRLIIKTIHEFGSSNGIRLYANESLIVGHKMYVKDVMITDTLTATTHINSNGTATTRAADIATVRDK